MSTDKGEAHGEPVPMEFKKPAQKRKPELDDEPEDSPSVKKMMKINFDLDIDGPITEGVGKTRIVKKLPPKRTIQKVSENVFHQILLVMDKKMLAEFATKNSYANNVTQCNNFWLERARREGKMAHMPSYDWRCASKYGFQGEDKTVVHEFDYASVALGHRKGYGPAKWTLSNTTEELEVIKVDDDPLVKEYCSFKTGYLIYRRLLGATVSGWEAKLLRPRIRISGLVSFPDWSDGVVKITAKMKRAGREVLAPISFKNEYEMSKFLDDMDLDCPSDYNLMRNFPECLGPWKEMGPCQKTDKRVWREFSLEIKDYTPFDEICLMLHRINGSEEGCNPCHVANVITQAILPEEVGLYEKPTTSE